MAERMRAERGYNLVEVLLAMALLGTVLLSVMGLFVQGRRAVYSGKQMTQAAAVATRVVEDLNTLNKTATLSAFGLQTATTGTLITVGTQSFPNSFVRTTTNITTATDPKQFLTRWRDLLVNDNKFTNGVVTLVFTPTADGTNNPAQMGTSTIVRIRVFVTWNEELRPREITLDAVKIERQ